MTVRIKAVLFDLDGTIIDTEPAAALAIEKSFTRWGIRLEPSDSRFVTGRTWDTAFEYLFGKYPIPLEPQRAKEEILASYRISLHQNLIVVPGSVAAIHSLASQYPLALVSGSWRAEILWALGHLKVRHLFHSVLGAEDYSQSKPAPDGYQAAMSQLSVSPRHTLVFEDSTAGIASARAAGAWVVAVTSTNHFNQDTSLAHHHIEDLLPVSTDWVRRLEEKIL